MLGDVPRVSEWVGCRPRVSEAGARVSGLTGRDERTRCSLSKCKHRCHVVASRWEGLWSRVWGGGLGGRGWGDGWPEDEGWAAVGGKLGGSGWVAGRPRMGGEEAPLVSFIPTGQVVTGTDYINSSEVSV